MIILAATEQLSMTRLRRRGAPIASASRATASAEAPPMIVTTRVLMSSGIFTPTPASSTPVDAKVLGYPRNDKNL